MTPERWRQVDRLYHEALVRPAVERAAWLDAASSGDEALRREVESLLAYDAAAAAFFAVSPVDVLRDPPLQSSETLEPGTTLGSHRIERLLGRGGNRTTGQGWSTTQDRARAATQHNGHPFSWRRSR